MLLVENGERPILAFRMTEKKWTWRPQAVRAEQNARLLQALKDGASYDEAADLVGMKRTSVAGVVRDARAKQGFDLPRRRPKKVYSSWGRSRPKPGDATKAS